MFILISDLEDACCVYSEGDQPEGDPKTRGKALNVV